MLPASLQLAYSKNRWFLKRYWFFARHFRNGPELIFSWLRQSPCSRAIQWDGRQVHHPVGHSGLAAALLELWFEDEYRVKRVPVPSGCVVVDAGANVGLFSIQIARRAPAARVIAIEPEQQCFECLQANLRAFSLTNVEVHRLGLGRHTGFAEIEKAARSLDNRLVNFAAKPKGSDSVAIVSMDDLFDRLVLNEVELLKMDIEGSEYDVFSNVHTETLTKIKTLVAEFHDNIRDGTLKVIRDRLSETHNIEILSHKPAGNGVVMARRRLAAPRR